MAKIKKKKLQRYKTMYLTIQNTPIETQGKLKESQISHFQENERNKKKKKTATHKQKIHKECYPIHTGIFIKSVVK